MIVELGGAFMRTFEVYHFLWLRGRVGSGKTTFAFYLANTLYKKGIVERMYSNIPSVAKQPEWGDDGTKAAYILDEGGMFMRSRGNFENVAAALRKAGNYVIIASVIPPAREFATLSVNLVADTSALLPFPLWLYEYELVSYGTREKGMFAFVNPQSVWGLFDTDFYPADDGGIEEFLVDEISKISTRSNKYNRAKTAFLQMEAAQIEADAAKMADGSTFGTQVEQAAGGIESAAYRIEAAMARLSKRRRR